MWCNFETFADSYIQNGPTRRLLSSLCKSRRSCYNRLLVTSFIFEGLVGFSSLGLTIWRNSPGAFTPGCSARHLPPYIEKLPLLKSKGVDIVACIAFNDAWVMSAWGKANGVKDEIVRAISLPPYSNPIFCPCSKMRNPYTDLQMVLFHQYLMLIGVT